MKKIKPIFFCLSLYCSNAIGQGVGIGTSMPAPSTALDINSVTGAVLLPRMNTSQRNILTASEGMIIYNTDFGKFQGYGLVSEVVDQAQTTTTGTCTGAACGSKWQSFTSAYTGILTSVKFQIQVNVVCVPTTVTVKLYSGSGIGGPLLQTTSFVASQAGAYYPIAPFHVSLTTGSVYTVEFISPSTGCNSTNDNVLWSINSNGGYAPGHCFCCSEQMNQDYYFVTYIGTFGWVNLY